MQHRITAVLAGLLLVLASHFTATAEPAPTPGDVNRALASGKPVVLIGVPASFLDGDSDDSEVASDWADRLGIWIENTADKKNLKVVIVPDQVLTKVLQKPVIQEDDCVALFVKNKTEGLLAQHSCVMDPEGYDVGAKWLEGTASPDEITEAGYKTTAVVARTRK
jgi:hypothetical protein